MLLLPLAFLKMTQTFLIISPAGTPKKVLIFVIVNLYLLLPSGVAFAAGSAVPQVNFVYFQSEGLVLKFVITTTCTYTLFEAPLSKFKRPWLPLVQSMVKLNVELSTGNSGVQESNR